MKLGNVYEVDTVYESISSRMQHTVEIHVKKALDLEKSTSNKPVVSITGKKKCAPHACIYVGKVVSASCGFVAGTRVVALGYSDAPLREEVIKAESKVVMSIPHGVDDFTVLFSGAASHWINMLKISNPPLGSMIRIGGQKAAALHDILSKVGYLIVEDETNADYFFPSDELSVGCGTKKVLWNEDCGADWNDERLFDTKYTYPHAYVNNTVFENLRTFWVCMQGTEWLRERWPIESIVIVDEESDACEIVAYLQDDIVSLDILGNAKYDLVSRKKPATVSMIVSAPAGSEFQKTAMRTVMSWIGSIPTKTTINQEKSYVKIAFIDGSVATIQFTEGKGVDHAQIHFDGKSIFVDNGKVVTYDCAGFGEFQLTQNDVELIKSEREKVVSLYEQL